MMRPLEVDLSDPKMKPFLSTLCTFYHDRTGVWLDAFEKPDDWDISEFDAVYGMEIYPKSLINLGK